MRHTLARHAALEAVRAKTSAYAMLHATACGMGVKDAHHGFNGFLRDMQTVIEHASGHTPADQTTQDEIAIFERIEARANAAS